MNVSRILYYSVYFFLLICLGRNGYAQSNGLYYNCTNLTSGYTLNAGTVIHPGGTSGAVSAAIPIGFGFKYGGEPVTQVWVSSNGWASFQAPPGSLPTNNLSTTPVPLLAPLWDSLKLCVTGNVNYKISGGSPNRVMKIEWLYVNWQNNATVDSSISFQIWLYEDAVSSALPSRIEYRYARISGAATNLHTPSGSIGMSGFCPGDFYADSISGGFPVIGPGCFSKLTDAASLSSKPVNTQVLRFDPVRHPNDWAAIAQNTPLLPNLPLQQFASTTFHSTWSNTVALPACWSAADTFDVWFKVTKPAGITNFELFTDQLDCRGAGYDPQMAVYTDTTAAAIACDATNSAGVAGATSSIYLVNQPCASTVYYVRVGTSQRAYFRFNIRPPGRNCTYANNITSCGIPYIAPTAPTGLSTCGFNNDYDSTASDCHNSFNKGEDYVYSYTPPATICVDFHLNNTPAASFPALFIYNGCPNAGNCLGSLTGAGGSAMNFNNITLASGNTYFFVVEYDSTNLTPCLSAFDFSITLNGTSPPVYDNCASAPNVPVNSSSSANCTGLFTYYNSCATPSAPGTVPVPTCGVFSDGVTPDVWFKFTSSGLVQAHTINVNPTSPYAGTAQDLCMQIYDGTCGSLTPLAGACDDNSSGFNLPALTFIPPLTNTVYYIRLWSNDGTQPGNFNICAIVGCTPANDLPCNAVNLTLGIPTNGDNACSSGASESGAASCWSGGTLNTVWYKFTPTFNGSVNIRTRLFSLFDSQIALYNAPCGPAMTQIGAYCNDDITEGCASAQRTYRHSVINGFPVTNGTTYFIRLDGRNANTGTFEILVIDASQPLPPVPLQDCVVAQAICGNASFTVADPGYQGIGHYCDLAAFPGCFIGERSSAWYLVSIQNPAPPASFFQFSINPFAGTDYDFAVWRVDGVANYCQVLNNYTIPGFFPWFRGSWTDTYGPTGVSLSAGSGTTSLCISAVGPPFHPAYPVTGGETFLILVSNWWGNTSGFTMDWLGTPIAGTPPVRYWQNATDSLWSNTFNWAPLCGGVPDCANQIAAVITNATPVAPYMATSTTVKDITVNIGATLRMAPGVTLSVCGDFTNNGTLICGAGSTIKFIGTAALQNINGTFTAANCFPNFVVNKGSGTVKLNTHIYISGNDSIQSGILDNNSKNTFLQGNFYNYNGATSFTNMGAGAGGSTFSFTGAANQNFTNLVSNLTFNNVTAFQAPASTITLGAGVFNNLIIGTSGILTLTAGRIVTAALRVDVTNTAAGAVTPGTIFGFVQGNLRRAIPTGFGTPATYEFPVGEATKGYQRFSLTYTTAPTIAHLITGKFTQWSVLPPTGPAVIECITANWSCCAPYDNGYWTLDASSGSGLGTYTANAYPLAVTNDIGAAPNGYSIMKAPSASGAGPWAMQGVCVTPGTGVNPVSRTGLNSFSDFGVVQYLSPLPIVLLSFDADQSPDGTVLASWATASEINNDHFEIERSTDGHENFKQIGTVKGFGAGTTTQNHYYSFRDPEQCSGLNYYRLKQVDIDGHHSYSDVVAVRCREKDDIVSVFPNPSNTKITISFYEVTDGKATIELLDMFGNILSTTVYAVTKDLNHIEMKIDLLPNGFYYFRLKNAEAASENSRQVKFLKY